MNTWYLSRLKTMSFPEILFRTGRFIKTKSQQVLYRNTSPHSEFLFYNKNLLNPDISSFKLYPETIDIFGKKFNYAEREINWHKDIFSEECFPVISSTKINIQNNPKASAKNVWELNRLQFLLHIAINYTLTNSDYYLKQFVKILSSWIDNNPYLKGINWYSNIEVNIRLINWFLCWEILDIDNLTNKNNEFRSFLVTKWIPEIYQHCHYSFHNPSRFSSANNHLIAEYAGLFVASALWKFKETDNWLRYSAQGLETEIKRQHSSGINREESAEYIQFITDFLLLPFLIGEKNNRPFSEEYKKQLYEIFKYIYDFLDCRGNFPKYGDEDDGKCYFIDPYEKFNNFISLLISGSIIYKDDRFKFRTNGLDYKNQFLFGKPGKKIYDSIPNKRYTEASRFYQDEGHFIFRKTENEREIYFHFDAAPLGYLSIAAHGHSDALSFVMHIDGQPVFIDSGTYTYHTEPEWRKYFIGTLAHNTVRINQKDQATNCGPTLWINHYKSNILNWKQEGDMERVMATHNGYKNEKAGHIREIIFDKTANEFHVQDTISVKGKKTLQIEIPFHIHPDIKINISGENYYSLIKNDIKIGELFIDRKLIPRIISGQIKPDILGWYSESFLKKAATNVIFCQTEIERISKFEFVIKII